MTELCITWVKSAIGYNKRQRMTLRALGFHSLNESVVQRDSPEIRGMIDKVRHLVTVEEIAKE